MQTTMQRTSGRVAMRRSQFAPLKARLPVAVRVQVDTKPSETDTQQAAPYQPSELDKLTGWTPPQAAAAVVPRNRDPELQQPAVPYSPEIQPSGSAGQYGVSQYPILGPIQEAVNGRAAMLGWVSAVAVELATHQGVVSQLFGKYENQELVEKPIGESALIAFAIVILNIAAALMPKLLDGEEPGARSFGPFTPGRETILGRTAMLGFLGLIVVELFKGSSLF